jgi:hypothetical protein
VAIFSHTVSLDLVTDHLFNNYLLRSYLLYIWCQKHKDEYDIVCPVAAQSFWGMGGDTNDITYLQSALAPQRKELQNSVHSNKTVADI